MFFLLLFVLVCKTNANPSLMRQMWTTPIQIFNTFNATLINSRDKKVFDWKKDNNDIYSIMISSNQFERLKR
jgi:hypothetical protein